MAMNLREIKGLVDGTADAAYALDPTLIPQEWTDKALETVKGWIPADA